MTNLCCYVIVLLLAGTIQADASTCDTKTTRRYIILDCGFGHPRSHPSFRWHYSRHNYYSIIQSSTITCENVTFPLVYNYSDSYYQQYLNVTESRIPSLPHAAFANFPTIRKLFLNNLNIQTVSPRAFDGLSNLKELHLDFNNITRFTPFDLKQLETLSLAHNSIQKLNLSAVHSLKVLSLTDNDIASVSAIQLPHLDKLDLSNNLIYEFATLDANHIVLDNNSLTSLGAIEANTTSLQARHNKIRTLSLQHVELKLKDLDLGFNQLTRLKTGQFINMERLERLKLDHNSITDIEGGAFERLHQLRELDLSFNAIKKFETGTFDNLIKLQSLSVLYNPLIDRSALSGLTTRLKLDLNLD